MIIADIEYVEIDDRVTPCMTIRQGSGAVIVNSRKYVVPLDVVWILDDPDVLKDRLPKIAEYIGLDPLSSSDQRRIFNAINDKIDDLIVAPPYDMLLIKPPPVGEAKLTVNGKSRYIEV